MTFFEGELYEVRNSEWGRWWGEREPKRGLRQIGNEAAVL